MCCEPLPFGQLRGTEPHSQTRVRSTPVHVNMSQYVARATGVAKQAAEVFSKRVVPPAVDYYNATMARNAEYVVKDPAAVDKLGRQLVFSNLAKLPGMVEGARAEVNIVKQKWAGRMDLPMAEVRTDLTRTHPPDRRPTPFFAHTGAPTRGATTLRSRATSDLAPSLPSSQVGTAALFAGEVYAWFCVGEIIGRGGSLTGY